MRAVGLIAIVLIGLSVIQPIRLRAESSLKFAIDPNGKISVNIEIDLTDIQIKENKATFSGSAIWNLILPFGWGALSAITGAPSDVMIIPFKQTNEYTLIFVIAPANLRKFNFQVQNLPILKETTEGKARLLFDLSFKFMSALEKSLFDASYTISDFALSVEMPTKYPEDQVVYRPFDIIRDNLGTRYDLSMQSYDKIRHDQKSQEAWIVFPNPVKNSNNLYRIILSILSGAIAVAIGYQTATKENQKKWYIAGALSCIMLVGLCWFYTASASGIDLLVWAAALVPPSVVAIGVSVILILARNFQATIRGQALVGGVPAMYANVELTRIDNGGQVKTISRKDIVKGSGEYGFGIWLRGKKARRFKVTVRYQFSSQSRDEKSSEEIEVFPGEDKILPQLVLAQPVSVSQAPHGNAAV